MNLLLRQYIELFDKHLENTNIFYKEDDCKGSSDVYYISYFIEGMCPVKNMLTIRICTDYLNHISIKMFIDGKVDYINEFRTTFLSERLVINKVSELLKELPPLVKEMIRDDKIKKLIS